MPLANFGWLEGLVGAVIAIGGGVTLWQRTRSKDGVERAEDGAKVGMISRLQEEANHQKERADRLFDELQMLGDRHTEDARAIARLQTELDHVNLERLSLRRNLRRMAEGLSPELRAAWEQALETDFAPLDDRPHVGGTKP
jgi:uncharacterized membrane protein YccC